MLETSDLKPLQRQCLNAPGRQLVRTKGGFAPLDNKAAVFTTRTVFGLDTAGLLRLAGSFNAHAELTAPGKRLAEQLREAEQAKAGAA